MPVAASWDAFGRIEMDESAPGDAVNHAPNLRFRIGAQIGGCRLAFRATIEVEPKPVTPDPCRPPFEGAHPAPLLESAVMHVRAEGEIPDFLPRMPFERDAEKPVMAPRQNPRPRNPSSPSDHRS